MKDMIREYGKMMISAAAASLLFLILFGVKGGETGSLLEGLGAKAVIESGNFSAYQDTAKSVATMEHQRPLIWLELPEPKTGAAYSADQLFTAKDAEGNPAKLQMVKVTDSRKEEVELVEDKVIFVRQGIYEVRVKAIDMQCGVTENVFFVPVKRR